MPSDEQIMHKCYSDHMWEFTIIELVLTKSKARLIGSLSASLSILRLAKKYGTLVHRRSELFSDKMAATANACTGIDGGNMGIHIWEEVMRTFMVFI